MPLKFVNARECIKCGIPIQLTQIEMAEVDICQPCEGSWVGRGEIQLPDQLSSAPRRLCSLITLLILFSMGCPTNPTGSILFEPDAAKPHDNATDPMSSDPSSSDLRPSDLRPSDLSSSDLRSNDLRPSDLSSSDLGPSDMKSSDTITDLCAPCAKANEIAWWSGLMWSCLPQGDPNLTSGPTTPSVCPPTNAGSVDFAAYDEVNLAPVYVMANGHGNDVQEISVGLSKWYNWMMPPSGDNGTGTWYRFETHYLNAMTDCDNDGVAESPTLQVGHRYISTTGTLFEIGGQPVWKCGDPTFNVYADIDRGGEPIVIAPSSQTSGEAYFSEWWQTLTPFNTPPPGYPTSDFQMAHIMDPGTLTPVGSDYVYSQATILEELREVTLTIPGHGSKTYSDVVVVLWRHGTKLLKWGGSPTAPIQQFGVHPCGPPPALLDLDGWVLYGSIRFYARHKPAMGQAGGPLVDQLLWQCTEQADGSWSARGLLAGSPQRSYSWYRRWW